MNLNTLLNLSKNEIIVSECNDKDLNGKYIHNKTDNILYWTKSINSNNTKYCRIYLSSSNWVMLIKKSSNVNRIIYINNDISTILPPKFGWIDANTKNITSIIINYDDTQNNLEISIINNYISKNIELTVALPLYLSRDIVWLALEGLINQSNINFDWELIVMEELSESVGVDWFEQYKTKLHNIRCARIIYVSIKKWIPLSKKWIAMGRLSSYSSKIMLLQAADCFNHEYRLSETFDIYTKLHPHWIHTKYGYFYDISSDLLSIYIHDLNKTVTGLSMAIELKSIRSISTSKYPKRYVDTWLFNLINNIHNNKIKLEINKSNNWNKSLDTNGFNKISKGRKELMTKVKPPFIACIGKPTSMQLLDIINKLKNIKDLTTNNVYIS